MKVNMVTFENKAAGEISLSDDVFGKPSRKDVLHSVVVWQLAKRQSGTHKTKTITEISGTGKKPFKQKGTGRARQGSTRSVQMRGGAISFGPVVRSHAKSLPKKIRSLALKTALSVRQAEGKLVVIKEAKLKEAKTSAVAEIIKKNGWASSLIIDGEKVDDNFKKSIANLVYVDILPAQGANVYDILRKENLILTEEGVKKLEERLS